MEKLKKKAKMIQTKKITAENQINIGNNKYMSVREILEARRMQEGLKGTEAILHKLDHQTFKDKIGDSVEE